MKSNILIVYQFATFGGVERVLLNRAEVLKKYKKNYKLFIYFFDDFGSKETLKDYIKEKKLENYIEIVDELKPKLYDYVVSIDTPNIFENRDIDMSKLIVETHTFEKKYREYLLDNFDKVKKVIVPSEIFLSKIVEDYKIKNRSSIAILSNFVLANEDSMRAKINLPKWNKKIVFYFGRIDRNKNLKELVDALEFYKAKYYDDIMLITVGNSDSEYNLPDYVYKKHLSGQIAIFPPISFDKVSAFLDCMKEKKAVFVSPSKGESFGLSAAESIAHGTPTILSDIEAHKWLVSEHRECLYTLGKSEELAERISEAFQNYEEFTKIMEKCKDKFSEKRFLEEWDKLFSELKGESDERDNS